MELEWNVRSGHKLSILFCRMSNICEKLRVFLFRHFGGQRQLRTGVTQFQSS